MSNSFSEMSTTIYGFCNKNGQSFECPTRTGSFCMFKNDCAYKEPLRQLEDIRMQEIVDKGIDHLKSQETIPERKIIPCPVCKSIDIEEIRNNNEICGPGYHSWVIHEVCKNCGVHLNPKRKEI